MAVYIAVACSPDHKQLDKFRDIFDIFDIRIAGGRLVVLPVSLMRRMALILVRPCWRTPHGHGRKVAIAFSLENFGKAPFADLMTIPCLILW